MLLFPGDGATSVSENGVDVIQDGTVKGGWGWGVGWGAPAP